MKSYTDLEQSKILSKILPLESADMFYTTNSDYEGKIIGLLDVPLYISSDGFVDTEIGEIYAWSLAALLEIIKKLVGYSLQSLDTHTVFMNCELGDKPYNIETENYDNPIDACYEMIIKLHELNLLRLSK